MTASSVHRPHTVSHRDLRSFAIDCSSQVPTVGWRRPLVVKSRKHYPYNVCDLSKVARLTRQEDAVNMDTTPSACRHHSVIADQ